MKMRPVYACLMVLFFTTMGAFAQDQDQQGGERHQPPSTEEIVSKMQSTCNLTQDQVTAVTPIIQKYMDQRQQLRQSIQDGTADRSSIRSQMSEIADNEKQDLSQILTQAQLSQCSRVISPGRHKHNNGGGSWGNGSNTNQGNGNEGGQGQDNS